MPGHAIHFHAMIPVYWRLLAPAATGNWEEIQIRPARLARPISGAKTERPMKTHWNKGAHIGMGHVRHIGGAVRIWSLRHVSLRSYLALGMFQGSGDG